MKPVEVYLKEADNLLDQAHDYASTVLTQESPNPLLSLKYTETLTALAEAYLHIAELVDRPQQAIGKGTS